MTLLKVDSIDVHYGDFQALYGVSVSVAAGETLAIIGANGAGKSTLMKALAGLMTPTAGSIAFEGRDVTAMRASSEWASALRSPPKAVESSRA